MKEDLLKITLQDHRIDVVKPVVAALIVCNICNSICSINVAITIRQEGFIEQEGKDSLVLRRMERKNQFRSPERLKSMSQGC